MATPQQISHYPSWPLPVLQEVTVTEPHACSYLPGRTASFRAFQASTGGRMTGEEYQRWMDAGFRRSGSIIYQPACAKCRACTPLRVSIEELMLSKGQRRVLRRNEDLQVRVGRPMPTAEKWELYDRYQREWHDGKQAGDILGFVSFLYRSPVETAEFEYRDRADKLVGVGLCDISPKSVSSVYFYFDPAESARSPGTFSALYEMLWAREMKIPYWYAGYWINGSATMGYKSRFRPCETLNTDGEWRELSAE